MGEICFNASQNFFLNVSSPYKTVPSIISSSSSKSTSLTKASYDCRKCRYYGLTNKQMKAITETLMINAYVENLILEDNFFNPEIIEMLSSVLQKK
ncbi:hypothetical protein NQ318_008362 [Aromia moschata]|uniref:Uncharacterized protein n=1 Tax=Aromia moschata TaxID=1265417 RepID=A0AAV8YK71_9CUCU|nr:hypothetical protein NQ318_008362 [Aromia moschata]